MRTFSANGVITIKRLRNGDTLYLTLSNNGKPLFQAVNPSNGTVSPDWGIDGNRPILAPKCYTSKGAVCTLSNHKWQWNGTDIEFKAEAGSDGYALSENCDGRFSIGGNGELKMMKNLASVENSANDTLTYSATATVDGVEYAVTKSIDVIIHKAGETTYFSIITANPSILTSSEANTTLKLSLWDGTAEVEPKSYYVKWLKGIGNEVVSQSKGEGNDTLNVSRNDVSGTEIFAAEVYKDTPGDGEKPLSRASIRITDIADEYKIMFRYLPDEKGVVNTAVEPGKDVKVQGFVWNVTQSKEVSAEVWAIDIQDPESGNSLLTGGATAQDTVTVTTAHTDAGGIQRDVIVVAEAQW